MSRLEDDLALLRAEFPNVCVGRQNDHFVLPELELPPGLFTQSTTRLLVVVPPTYPTAPADNFYVGWGLALQAGGSINNYSGPAQLYGEQWGVFSFHVTYGGWNAAHDTFLTFLTAVRSRLQEGA